MEVSIYQAINKLNGKGYIGITNNNPNTRWREHQLSKNDYVFSRALRKYPISAFDFVVLEKVQDWDSACKKERLYIARFNTKIPNGYNMTDGGEGTLGYIFSKEQKRNLSNAHKGKGIGEDNPFYGEKHTEESKGKIAAVHKGNIYNLGRQFTEEHKNKLSESHKGLQNHLGFKHSEETKEKIRKSKTGSIHSVETKKKMSETHKGRKMSKEFRQKIRDSWVLRRLKSNTFNLGGLLNDSI